MVLVIDHKKNQKILFTLKMALSINRIIGVKEDRQNVYEILGVVCGGKNVVSSVSFVAVVGDVARR